MSKKKPAKKSTNEKTSSAEESLSAPVIKEKTPKPAKTRPEFELIRFDKKTIFFLLACTILFMLFVSLKWHNSSVPFWNQVIHDGGDINRGIIAGQPLPIRSDEWLLSSSFMVAQYRKGFPKANEAIGYGNTPLVWKLPTTHVTSKIRPNFWGFYILDIERAFSWHWNFKIFPFLMASFLFFMLLTRNHFALSLFGSFWLLLSSAIQWWSINTELFTWGCLSVISFLYVLISNKPRTIVLSGIILFFASFSFAMILYPPYQVPLSYFWLAILIGYILLNKAHIKSMYFRSSIWKIGTLASVLTLLFVCFYMFYQEGRETIEVMTQTIYPGKRSELGGDFNFFKMFTDNFRFFVDHDTFPAAWINICELSSWVMLSPLVSIVLVTDHFRSRKTNVLLVSILVFHMIIYIWLFAGFPHFLADISLFKMSPTFRTLYILGYSNIIATILFLAHHRPSFIRKNLITGGLSFLGIFLMSYFIHHMLNKQAESFFSSWQVWIGALLFSILNWLVIHFHLGKLYRIGFFVLFMILIIPNFIINPLSVGLSPYFENKFFMTVSDIHARDPHAKWLVFGKQTYANYLKAAGINCFNGLQYAPHLEQFSILDPKSEFENVYNRYAHITFTSQNDGLMPVDFKLMQQDLYSVKIDPCSQRLHQLGIKYFLFTYKPDPIEVSCMRHVSNPLGLAIYTRVHQ